MSRFKVDARSVYSDLMGIASNRVERLEARTLLAADAFLYDIRSEVGENHRFSTVIDDVQLYDPEGLVSSPRFTANDPKVTDIHQVWGDGRATMDATQRVELVGKTTKKSTTFKFEGALETLLQRAGGAWPTENHIQGVGNNTGVDIFGLDADGYTAYKVSVDFKAAFSDPPIGIWMATVGDAGWTTSSGFSGTYFVPGDLPREHNGSTYERVLTLAARFNDQYIATTGGDTLALNVQKFGRVSMSVKITAYSTKPVLAIKPKAVSFGRLAPSQAVDRELMIRNANSNPLSTLTVYLDGIHEPEIIRLEHSDEPITRLVDAPGSFSLGPGESRTLTLRMAPKPLLVGRWTEELWLTTTDPDRAKATINLTGTILPQVLHITEPSQHWDGRSARVQFDVLSGMDFEYVVELVKGVVRHHFIGAETVWGSNRIPEGAYEFSADVMIDSVRHDKIRDFSLQAWGYQMSQNREMTVIDTQEVIRFRQRTKSGSRAESGVAVGLNISLAIDELPPRFRGLGQIDLVIMYAKGEMNVKYLELDLQADAGGIARLITDVDTTHRLNGLLGGSFSLWPPALLIPLPGVKLLTSWTESLVVGSVAEGLRGISKAVADDGISEVLWLKHELLKQNRQAWVGPGESLAAIGESANTSFVMTVASTSQTFSRKMPISIVGPAAQRPIRTLEPAALEQHGLLAEMVVNF